MAPTECDREHPVFNDLLLHFLKGAKMEQKQIFCFLKCKYMPALLNKVCKRFAHAFDLDSHFAQLFSNAI
jgi:hypothetical protein